MFIVANKKNVFLQKKVTMKEKLFFRNRDEARLVDPSTILYVIADGHYSVFHLSTGISFYLYVQLGDVLKKMQLQLHLTCEDFVRVGRSLIINLTYLHYILPAQGKLELLDKNLDKVVLDASEKSLRELADLLDNRFSVNH